MKALRRLAIVGVSMAVMASLGPASALVGLNLDRGDLADLMDSNNDAGTPGIEQTGDITHVANIPWTARGSDLEFATKEVVKLSEGATGDPVCVTDAEGECAVDEEGNTIFQTEVRDFAIAGVYSQGAKIVDITDPEDPVLVAESPCRAVQNDIQIQGDLLVQAQDGGTGQCTRPDGSNQTFNGSAVMDFSDPRNPTYLSRVQYGRGSHNHTFHPTEPLLYLSDSDVAPTAGLGNIPIWDLSDPEAPVLVTQFQHLVHSPHDITFNADGSRAYVAAVSATYILNTEDPRDPSLISTIYNEGISISHQSDPTPDGNFLLVSDELGGGAAGVPPGGPVHVYSIHDETAPVKIGIIENNCLQETCQSATSDGAPISTSHVFRINPDGWTMAIGWYKDGMFVIDYSALAGGNAGPSGESTPLGPRVIAGMKLPGSNTWTAKMHQERLPGYVFSNDVRGLDVFHVPDLGGDFLAYGSITAANPAIFLGGPGATKTEFESDCNYAPRSQGVDGWVQAIPADLADGSAELTGAADDALAGEWDLDYYFYDEECTLIAAIEDESIGAPETMNIPDGSAYVLVVNFLGEPVRVRLDAS